MCWFHLLMMMLMIFQSKCIRDFFLLNNDLCGFMALNPLRRNLLSNTFAVCETNREQKYFERDRSRQMIIYCLFHSVNVSVLFWCLNHKCKRVNDILIDSRNSFVCWSLKEKQERKESNSEISLHLNDLFW